MLEHLISLLGPSFTCPVCHYHGKFRAVPSASGLRPYARCPKCRALERHRLQHLVIEEEMRTRDASLMAMLQVAPKPFFAAKFRKRFAHYLTADLSGQAADLRFQLSDIPFSDASFDIVFAAHVLERVVDDRRAMTEVARVLKPGGFAVLPVQVIGETTVEYLAPNAFEGGNIRCPGKDYFWRLRASFRDVKLYSSDYFPEKHQLFCFEDRSRWPATMPQRPSVKGKKHVDYVPVCFK